MTSILQPDFAVLDAYFDMWQQVAAGGKISPGFVDRLLMMPQLLPSLVQYQEALSISGDDLRNLLLSLTDCQLSAPSLLADFRRANLKAIHSLGHVFDIIFPLRRLRLARTFFEVAGPGRDVPPYIRVMPDVMPNPYLVDDALVVDFFSLSLNERGHIVVGGVPLDRFIAARLHKLL